MNERLKKVCDTVTESHARIQEDFEDINPMVGVNQKMREMDLPVDIVTIDCLKNNKRILIILHDHYPDVVRYQFTFRDVDPAEGFDQVRSDELTADKIYRWITDYFRSTVN